MRWVHPVFTDVRIRSGPHGRERLVLSGDRTADEARAITASAGSREGEAAAAQDLNVDARVKPAQGVEFEGTRQPRRPGASGKCFSAPPILAPAGVTRRSTSLHRRDQTQMRGSSPRKGTGEMAPCLFDAGRQDLLFAEHFRTIEFRDRGPAQLADLSGDLQCPCFQLRRFEMPAA